ncbi:hypothetical protein E1211_15370 [Micromonospora sp. 15K316]|uniref:hypothetical protein n=1 Tax=unclassified Micromonospora TaxID=2617518 RepID=UPI001050E442|nr:MULTISPECIES: hypothetical protein [unclassified Micromonospora]TDB71813.1 hypothetical protein E1165_22055 [Micromonospora sp. KC723]TDC35683.1 hypothetical protein E1211_15370 [Micromonospora sp. 15K316]
MTPPVFPAAAATAVAVDEHPPFCPCLACTDDLLARLARPLVPGGPRTDPALTGHTDSPTGPRPSGHPHIVSGPVGAKPGAAAAGVAAAPTPGRCTR